MKVNTNVKIREIIQVNINGYTMETFKLDCPVAEYWTRTVKGFIASLNKDTPIYTDNHDKAIEVARQWAVKNGESSHNIRLKKAIFAQIWADNTLLKQNMVLEDEVEYIYISKATVLRRTNYQRRNFNQ